MQTVDFSWGDALVVQVFKAPKGLQGAVEAIRAAVGSNVGSRNTFAKLLRVESVESLTATDRWRAWLLLAALGQDPTQWGLSDEDVPAALDATAIAAAVQCPRRDSNPRPSL